MRNIMFYTYIEKNVYKEKYIEIYRTIHIFYTIDGVYGRE